MTQTLKKDPKPVHEIHVVIKNPIGCPRVAYHNLTGIIAVETNSRENIWTVIQAGEPHNQVSGRTYSVVVQVRPDHVKEDLDKACFGLVCQTPKASFVTTKEPKTSSDALKGPHGFRQWTTGESAADALRKAMLEYTFNEVATPEDIVNDTQFCMTSKPEDHEAKAVTQTMVVTTTLDPSLG